MLGGMLRVLSVEVLLGGLVAGRSAKGCWVSGSLIGSQEHPWLPKGQPWSNDQLFPGALYVTVLSRLVIFVCGKPPKELQVEEAQPECFQEV